MNRTLLIAWQNYARYVTRRGFIIGVFLFPLWVAFGAVVPSLVQRSVATRDFVVVDHEGGYRDAIANALTRSEAERTLAALAEIAKTADRAALAKASPTIADILDHPHRPASIDAFLSSGGWQPFAAALAAHGAKAAAAFKPPRAEFALDETPPDLENDSRAVISTYISGARTLPDGHKPFAVLVIPQNFGTEATPADYWSGRQGDPALEGFLRDTLDEELRLRAALRLAPDKAQMTAALHVSGEMRVRDANPAKAGAMQSGTARTVAAVLPFGVAFLLFLATFINSTVLLMGVVEEKSTRVIEILVSCASPIEIMTGKLFAATGAALTTIVLWAGGLFIVAHFLWPGADALILDGLKSFSLVGHLPFVLVYFVSGLLIYGSIFLAIGSMAATVTDAQALSGPASLILLLPNVLIPSLMRDPNGAIATALSWVPFYSPYFMLFRLPSNPPEYQIWATSVLSALTALFLVFRMGHVFAANVLATERPPSFGKFIRGLFRRTKKA